MTPQKLRKRVGAQPNRGKKYWKKREYLLIRCLFKKSDTDCRCLTPQMIMIDDEYENHWEENGIERHHDAEVKNDPT